MGTSASSFFGVGVVSSVALGAVALVAVGVSHVVLRRRQLIKAKPLVSGHHAKGIPRLPSTLPVLGNALDMSSNLERIHDWILDNCVAHEGEPWKYIIPGRPVTVVLTSPELIEDVLKTQFERFDKGPEMHENLREFLGEGIFAVDGVQWLHQRRLATKLITIKALRESMADTIADRAATLYDILRDSQTTGKQVDLCGLMHRFTMDTFSQLAFGVHLDAINQVEDHPFQASFDQVLHAVSLRYMRPSIVWKTQRWLNVGYERELREGVATLDTAVTQFINEALERRTPVAAGQQTSESGARDVVSLAIAAAWKDGEAADMDPRQLRDIVVNFLLAGRDTTAQTFCWLFHNLSQRPQVEAKLRQEIQAHLPELMEGVDCKDTTNARPRTPSPDEIQCLVYLEAVVRETLRLHPPVPFNMRQANRETVLSDGTVIEKGWSVAIAGWAMARMINVWGEDAAEFRPDRWIDPRTGKLVAHSPFQFIAFHAGPRTCPGMQLALLELKMVVAGVLSQFHLAVVQGQHVTYGTGVTLPMKSPLFVHVRPAVVDA